MGLSHEENLLDLTPHDLGKGCGSGRLFAVVFPRSRRASFSEFRRASSLKLVRPSATAREHSRSRIAFGEETLTSCLTRVGGPEIEVGGGHERLNDLNNVIATGEFFDCDRLANHADVADLWHEGRREPGIEWEHCEVPALFFWNGITDPDEHDAAMEESIEMLRAAEAQQANQRPIQRRKRRRTDLIRPAVPGTTCRRRRDSDST
mgnify:CR=1 FL=1